MKLNFFILLSLALLVGISAQQCGSQADGALCPNGLCCSRWGFCGSGEPWCGDGCQSQCTPPSPPPPPPSPPTPPGTGVADIITEAIFEEMLKYRNDPRCPSNGFYTYNAFITAAASFNGFGTTGDTNTRKRELAAFFGQTSHETTGGWPTAPGGPQAWGYCFIREVGASNIPYCTPSPIWPCAPGQHYYGRGPIQLTHNYNYGLAGEHLHIDLLNNPDLVATDAVISFKTAIWFWMTPQDPKPSCHDVIIGQWTPTDEDLEANRLPGYGVTTNIINGGLECGIGPDLRVANRIGFYKRYCDMLGVSVGDNLDCYTQQPFGRGASRRYCDMLGVSVGDNLDCYNQMSVA